MQFGNCFSCDNAITPERRNVRHRIGSSSRTGRAVYSNVVYPTLLIVVRVRAIIPRVKSASVCACSWINPPSATYNSAAVRCTVA